MAAPRRRQKSAAAPEGVDASHLVETTRSFSTMEGNTPRVIRRGSLFKDDDAVVLANPDRFRAPTVRETRNRRVTGTPTGHIAGRRAALQTQAEADAIAQGEAEAEAASRPAPTRDQLERQAVKDAKAAARVVEAEVTAPPPDRDEMEADAEAEAIDQADAEAEAAAAAAAGDSDADEQAVGLTMGRVPSAATGG